MIIHLCFVNIKERLGHRIRALRTHKGISQQELSYRSGIDRTYIAQVESGKRNIAIVNIQKIAQALEISLKELFNDEEFNNDRAGQY